MKSLCLSVFIVLCAVIATATIGETVSAKPLLVPGKSRPFVDPVWGGAADPCIIYNDEAGEYFIYYTQRRANLAEPKGLRNWGAVLDKPAMIQGFRVGARLQQRDAALVKLTQWYREGRLKARETVAQGLESAPAAFISMLNGANYGKQVVRL